MTETIRSRLLPAANDVVKVANAGLELDCYLRAIGDTNKAADALNRRVSTYAAPPVYTSAYDRWKAALAGMGPLVCPRITLGDLLSKGDLIEPWPELRMPGSTYVAFTPRALGMRPPPRHSSPGCRARPPTCRRRRRETGKSRRRDDQIRRGAVASLD